MSTNTHSQSLHGKPRTFSEVFGLPAGSFMKHLKESEASGMSPEERSMMPTSELLPSAYEAHSKETMDEVRYILAELSRYPIETSYSDGSCIKREDMDLLQAALDSIKTPLQ